MNSTLTTERSAERPPGLLAEIVANMPASYFAIVLGLTSLGTAWRIAERAWQPPNFVAEWIYVAAGTAWTGLVVFSSLKILLARARPRNKRAPANVLKRTRLGASSWGAEHVYAG